VLLWIDLYPWRGVVLLWMDLHPCIGYGAAVDVSDKL
jgi:hypothetical protein